MQQTMPLSGPIKTAIALAELLHRLEASPRAGDAHQYQQVVRSLTRQLAEIEPGPALDAVLEAFPTAGVLYENLYYEHAGLCRSPLESSLNSELQTRAALQRAMGVGA
jgi:hypothetical protein